ncbi:MAG TPA: hypothetical protein PKU91_07730, partial [Phycisphaerales bacterium]|nr:hypothetical protein [Phycisphaerales bacterium]
DIVTLTINGQPYSGQFPSGGYTPWFGGVPFNSFNGLSGIGYPGFVNPLAPFGYGQAVGGTAIQPTSFVAAAGEGTTIRQAA